MGGIDVSKYDNTEKETTIKDIEQAFKWVLNSQQMKELDKKLRALSKQKLEKLKAWLNKPGGVKEKINDFYQELKEKWIVDKSKEIFEKWKTTFLQLMWKLKETAKQKWWDTKWEEIKQKTKEKWKSFFHAFQWFLKKHLENIWKAPDINYTKAWNESKKRFEDYRQQYKKIMQGVYEKMMKEIDILNQSK